MYIASPRYHCCCCCCCCWLLLLLYRLDTLRLPRCVVGVISTKLLLPTVKKSHPSRPPTIFTCFTYPANTYLLSFRTWASLLPPHPPQLYPHLRFSYSFVLAGLESAIALPPLQSPRPAAPDLLVTLPESTTTKYQDDAVTTTMLMRRGRGFTHPSHPPIISRPTPFGLPR